MKYLLPVLILAILAFSASAATYTVDANGTGDYLTIQAAINTAMYGDIIKVASGTYVENIELKNGVALIGAFAESTIIDGNSAGSVVVSRNCDSNTVLNSFTITNGYAGYGGGMSNSSGSNPLVTNCIFCDNTAASEGGGMGNFISEPTVTNCIFIRNFSGWNGGGMLNNRTRKPIISNCTFINNSASKSGGGICNVGGDPVVTNCTFNGNWSSFGGAIDNYWSDAFIVNCTLSGNLAMKGGGIYNEYSSPITTNCILWENIAQDGNEIALNYAEIDIAYCNIKGGKSAIHKTGDNTVNWGPGNIDVDPFFIDPGYWDANETPTDANDDFWVDGDYHLLPISSCINAGDPNYIPEPNETDLDGNPRVIGDRIDMGCYESNSLPVQMWIAPRAVNIRSRGRFITAVMTMPEGIEPTDINDAKPLLFMPGRIEATRQFVWQSRNWRHRRTYIMAVFDKSDCMENLSHGMNEINIIGRLNTGRFFYGTDNLRVIQWRPWLWRYHTR